MLVTDSFAKTDKFVFKRGCGYSDIGRVATWHLLRAAPLFSIGGRIDVDMLVTDSFAKQIKLVLKRGCGYSDIGRAATWHLFPPLDSCNTLERNTISVPLF